MASAPRLILLLRVRLFTLEFPALITVLPYPFIEITLRYRRIAPRKNPTEQFVRCLMMGNDGLTCVYKLFIRHRAFHRVYLLVEEPDVILFKAWGKLLP